MIHIYIGPISKYFFYIKKTRLIYNATPVILYLFPVLKYMKFNFLLLVFFRWYFFFISITEIHIIQNNFDALTLQYYMHTRNSISQLNAHILIVAYILRKKQSEKHIALLKILTYVQYRHDSIRKRIWQRNDITLRLVWFILSHKWFQVCPNISTRKQQEFSDKGAWYRTTDRKFSRFYCFAWATEVIDLALLSLRSERGAPWIWHLCSSTRHENTRPLTLEIVESH